jgi:hypothetical protein
MPPNISNGAHGHWRGRHSQKLAYWGTLDILKAAKQFPPPPRTPMEKASIRSVMYLGGAMDDSNAMRRHKWVEDWLKTRKYIKDDRKKCLTWEGFPEQVIRRDGNYRIEITLTHIPTTESTK